MENFSAGSSYKISSNKTVFLSLFRSVVLLFLSLLFFSPLSFAEIFQCKDPVTGKLTFTDKQCASSNDLSILSESGKKISPYSDYSFPALQSHLVKRENELSQAYRLLAFTSKNNNFAKFQKDSQIEQKAWLENRDSRCLQKFNESGQDGEPAWNKDMLICKIQNTEEKLDAFKKMASTGNPLDIAAENVRMTIGAGKPGLQEAVREGLIEPATSYEIELWLDAAGVDEQSDVFKVTDKYVIKTLVTFSGGLSGGNLVLFFVPDSTLMPAGNYGSSPLLFLDTGACTGILCSSLK
jgi:uncharacterized protein YecT (DUF1311 family)